MTLCKACYQNAPLQQGLEAIAYKRKHDCHPYLCSPYIQSIREVDSLTYILTSSVYLLPTYIIMKLTILLFAASASAAKLWCWGSGSSVTDADVRWNVHNRPTELGVPGNNRFSYQSDGECCDRLRDCARRVVLTAPSFTKVQSKIDIGRGRQVYCSVNRIENCGA